MAGPRPAMMRSPKRPFHLVVAFVGLLVALFPARADAHVGSPDVVFDGSAGPYGVLVTIVPPDVVPGIAAIEVRAIDADVDGVTIVPVPLRGEGVGSPPVADVTRRSESDPRLFVGQLWLMQTRPWQVRINVTGPRGPGALAVPVPALASGVKPMPAALGALLFALLALLVAGAVAIVASAAREADLPSGVVPDAARIRRGRIASLTTAAVLALALGGAALWWNVEASLVRRQVFKPLQANVQIAGQTMRLGLVDPGWVRWRRTDDFVPDHGHLMHLFLVRTPGLDAIAHLHPVRTGAASFEQLLPELPAGTYRAFADIVHATGLDETATASIDLAPSPAKPAEIGDVGGAPTGDADDAFAIVTRAASEADPVYSFADGTGQLRWSPIRPGAGETIDLEFRAQSQADTPLAYIESYMGMAGHAMIVAHDLSVFAHIHPNGSVPMASLMLVEDNPAPVVDHSAHRGMRFSPVVRFPYRFPRAGDYRVFVQIKTGGRIETAAFDVRAESEVRGGLVHR